MKKRRNSREYPTDVIQYDTYKLKWQYPIYKDGLPIHQDDEVYT